MAGNPLRGSARFTYPSEGDAENAREYLLVLDNGVWIEAEDVLGYSILDAVEDLRAALEAGRNPRLKVMCAIVYGGLKANHPHISQREVIDMFMSGDPEFRRAVLQAMQGAQPPAIPDDLPAGSAGGNGTAAAMRGGTGSASSRPGAKPGSTRKASGKRPRAR